MAADITKGVHLVGSVPLENAEQVFEAVTAHLGKHVRRIPDGETGPRNQWIGWTARRLMESPQLAQKYPEYLPMSPRTLGLRPGVTVAALRYPNLGYADCALESFQRFAELQGKGLIPPDCRFQVSLGTPLAVSSCIFGEAEFAALERSYETAHMQEVWRILNGIPHERLAIQWDVCLEVWFVEGWVRAPFASQVLASCVERLTRYAEAIPSSLTVDDGLRHVVQDHDSSLPELGRTSFG